MFFDEVRFFSLTNLFGKKIVVYHLKRTSLTLIEWVFSSHSFSREFILVSVFVSLESVNWTSTELQSFDVIAFSQTMFEAYLKKLRSQYWFFDEELGGSDFIKLSFSCFHLHEFEHESILQASQRSSSRENFFKKNQLHNRWT